MQYGEVIVDRWLVQAIEQICHMRDIELRRYSSDWILELRKGATTKRIFGYKFSLNDSAAANLAQDKVGAYQIMAAANVPAVAHALLRTKAGPVTVMPEWPQVVLKPLTGTSGHMVQVFDTHESATEYIRTTSVEGWTLSPRLAIVREVRLLVLDDEILVSYEKTKPNVTSGLAMFNLGQGAIPQNITPTNEMIQMALGAKNALGLRVCAVDIVELEDGNNMVLEVNDGVMMEYYSGYSDENRKNAMTAYDAIVMKMMNV